MDPGLLESICKASWHAAEENTFFSSTAFVMFINKCKDMDRSLCMLKVYKHVPHQRSIKSNHEKG